MSAITTLLMSVAVFGSVTGTVYYGYRPVANWVDKREIFFAKAFHQMFVLGIKPRTAAWLSAAAVPASGLLVYIVVEYWASPLFGAVAGYFFPVKLTEFLMQRRLEDQIVSGIQTLASGVRAGLNLVQSFELLARNAPTPLCQEMAQLLREYEYGLTLEQAMVNTGLRVGSPTYRLLFSALETHRQRGGNLGETLDRIADAIREIHRLEKQVETLTAQGRAAARMMGIMPFVILIVLNWIDPRGVSNLFDDPVGRFILLIVLVLNILGFLWIRKIVDIDI